MKHFLKIYIVSFIGFMILFSAVFIGADRLIFNKDSNPLFSSGSGEQSVEKSANIDSYIKDKKRLNILLLGADGGRSDTMMVLSIDLASQNMKMLSIPRDTYYHLEGYDSFAQRKINAVYGHGKGKGGAEGVKKAIVELTQLDIPYYVEVNYDGVKEIVDLIDGVEFEVPADMNYDDPTAKPPLHIHLKKGLQVLDGDKAMQFLRWRKNNGSEGTGDLDRIKRQQAFMVAAAKKAFGLKILMVMKAASENLETDLSTQEMIYLASKMMGADLEAIEKVTLPGDVGMKHGYSYLLPNEEKIKALHDLFTKVEEKEKK